MEIQIGRSGYGYDEQQLLIQERSVSKRHCTINVINNNSIQITDLSTFGTYIYHGKGAIREAQLLAKRLHEEHWDPDRQPLPPELERLPKGQKIHIKIDDIIFLGPYLSLRVKDLLVKGDGTSLIKEDSATQLFTSKAQKAPKEKSFTIQELNFEAKKSLDNITEFYKAHMNNLENIIHFIEKKGNRISGMYPYIFATSLAGLSIKKIYSGEIQSARTTLYRAGDLMYEIAKNGDEKMESIYAEMMIMLCRIYRAENQHMALDKTKEAATSILRHLKMDQAISNIQNI